MLSKKSLLNLIIILSFSLISLDLWHPHLDASRSLTKIFDLLYFPWISYLSNSTPYYQINADNFIFKRKIYPVSAEPDQHQWQITFTDQDFGGYSQLVLIAPEAVSFFQDSLALNQARQLGLITRDRWFATLKLNTLPPRVYQVVEAWNKDVLKKNTL